jgi:hypothetical protein
MDADAAMRLLTKERLEAARRGVAAASYFGAGA